MLRLAGRAARKIALLREERELRRIRRRYADFTMVPERNAVANLLLCRRLAPASGCVVECGVWRGGMSAAMAEVLPGRLHYLFDSFEGLPPATEADGPAAFAYQADTAAPAYFDNCRAGRASAERAMRMSPARRHELVQGWFEDTLPGFAPEEPVAVLRLDGDWYESTLRCLEALYPAVAPGGLVVLDDYYQWDGCARAVHEYLARRAEPARIREFHGVAFLVKPAPAGGTPAGRGGA